MGLMRESINLKCAKNKLISGIAVIMLL